MIAQARELYQNDSAPVNINATVYALDASTINLCLSLFPRAPLCAIEAILDSYPDSFLQLNAPSLWGDYFNINVAAEQERADILELLIQRGAHPDGISQPPIITAIIRNNKEMVELLLAYG